jgi:MFS family permease
MGTPKETGTTDDESVLWVMASIAFAIFYGNYMVAPLIPAFSNEFSVAAQQLGWVVPGYLVPYGISMLVYGAWSDWWGRARTLRVLLCFAPVYPPRVGNAGERLTS